MKTLSTHKLKSHITLLYDVALLFVCLLSGNTYQIYAFQDDQIQVQSSGNEVVWREGNNSTSAYSLKLKNVSGETSVYHIEVLNNESQSDFIHELYGVLIQNTDYVLLDTGVSQFEWYDIEKEEYILWSPGYPTADPPTTKIKDLLTKGQDSQFVFPFFGEEVNLKNFSIGAQGGIGYFPEADGDFFSYSYPFDDPVLNGAIFPILSVVPEIEIVFYKEYENFVILQFNFRTWISRNNRSIYQIKIESNGDISFNYKLLEYYPPCNAVGLFTGMESLDGKSTHMINIVGPECPYEETVTFTDLSRTFKYEPTNILVPEIDQITLEPNEEVTIDFYPRINLSEGQYNTNVIISKSNEELYKVPIFATVLSNKVKLESDPIATWTVGSNDLSSIDVKIINSDTKERDFIIKTAPSSYDLIDKDKFVSNNSIYASFEYEDITLDKQNGNWEIISYNFKFPDIIKPENKLSFPGFYTPLGGGVARFGDILAYNNRPDSTFKFSFFDGETYLKDMALSEYGYLARYLPPSSQYYPPYDFEPGDVGEPNGLIVPFVGEIRFNKEDELSGIFYDEVLIQGERIAALYFHNFKSRFDDALFSCKLLILKNGDLLIEKEGDFDNTPGIRKTVGLESMDGENYIYRNINSIAPFNNQKIYIFKDRYPLLIQTGELVHSAAESNIINELQANWRAIPGVQYTKVFLDEIIGNDTLKNVARTTIYSNAQFNACSFTNQNLSISSNINTSSSAASWWQADRMIDGNPHSRWSTSEDQAEILLDLQNVVGLDEMKIYWDYARARSYAIYSKINEQDDWGLIYSSLNNEAVYNLLLFKSISVRYLKIVCRVPFTTYGYSIKELEIYGSCVNQPVLPAGGNIIPYSLYMEVGEKLALEAYIYRSDFTVIEMPDGEWSIDGENVFVDENGILTALSPGVFTVYYQFNNLTLERTGFVKPGDCNIDPTINLALNKPSYGSSWENPVFQASKANDGNFNSRWSSHFKDNQWYYIELNEVYKILGINIDWNYSAASSYELQYRDKTGKWNVFYQNMNANGGTEQLKFEGNIQTDAIRLWGFERNTEYGFSIHEFQVYGSCSDQESTNESISTSVFAYPNPIIQSLKLKLSTERQEKYTLKLYDSNFNLYFSSEIELGFDPVDLPYNLSALPVGVYILKLVSENGDTSSIKLVKE
ncbi:discoidin domain-containing protein [Mangrovivirga cuniculi]|nr:discoidin domain-containing protein [Mangrovivirga cuniculi]